MRFVDLFAGLGGFHLALRALGHECVFASEIDETLQNVYQVNFGIQPAGDIRKVDADDIPSHDILCAGFPCQPFSKARDYSAGPSEHLSDLYLQIIKVIQHHHPRFIILENVPNLTKHAAGQTWERIEYAIRSEGYDVASKKLSPHQFGIPQIRERIYIVASRHGLDQFRWPDGGAQPLTIESVLDTHPSGARLIPNQVQQCLLVWQEFLDHIPADEKVPHPLWSMEFGATYPYEGVVPSAMPASELRRYRGSHGTPLRDAASREELLLRLPSHARNADVPFPVWKRQYIRKNRAFYERHHRWLDDWIPKIRAFPSSFQKLEWNCQEEDPRLEWRQIMEYVIQIRPSGVRVKRRTTAPSLVALTATQVPIIAWEGRYMTPQECKRLQSMDELILPAGPTKAYKALGNAINVHVARAVAEALLAPDGITRLGARQLTFLAKG